MTVDKITTHSLVSQFIARHGELYDYNEVTYINYYSKVVIGCRIHGAFKQNPHSHKNGSGCPKCARNSVPTSESMIRGFKGVHANRYDYSSAMYTNAKTKVLIRCLDHGEFKQIPNKHLSGSGCPKCVGLGLSTTEILIQFAEVHGDTYDYSLVEYVGARTKVNIICGKHGGFCQTPTDHKSGRGCPHCAESGFDPAKPTILYYVVYAIDGTKLYKIGTTNRDSVVARLGKSDTYTILVDIPMPEGYVARATEKHILSTFNKHNATHIHGNRKYLAHGGETECHTVDILELDNCVGMVRDIFAVDSAIIESKWVL